MNDYCGECGTDLDFVRAQARNEPIVARTVAETHAEYWKKELDELQPILRYAMHVQRKLSEARKAIEEGS